VVALVVWKSGQPNDAALRSLVEQRLSAYKRPAQYLRIRRDEVPLGSTSKPQRAALAEIAARRLR
jgi:acyl-CoA synthetase (AMP-forming)/AMP-acid ligase II